MIAGLVASSEVGANISLISVDSKIAKIDIANLKVGAPLNSLFDSVISC